MADEAPKEPAAQSSQSSVPSAGAKPSLHEIAAMPRREAIAAMRKYYDPEYGKPVPEGKLRVFHVQVHYSYSGSDTWITEVEARSENEAEELAGKEFDEADLDLPYNAEVDAADFTIKETSKPLASATLTRKGGDAAQIVAPFMSGAVPQGDAQTPSGQDQ